MRIWLVGGGGREHALAWKLAQSSEVTQLLCAPGNAGIAQLAKTTCFPVSAEDVEGQIASIQRQQPDLVVVGPELPLTLGLADRLSDLGVSTFGPGQKAAMLEGSKVFAKQLMRRCGIPSADFESFGNLPDAIGYIRSHPGPWVVKADGLAAGKGVVVCHTQEDAERALQQMMQQRVFGPAGNQVVIESFLVGEEVSCLALCDGSRTELMAFSQDHKRAYDHDQGPNTGGMGAYSPVPFATEAFAAQVRAQVFDPLLKGFKAEGIDFRGVLYAGLMIDQGKIMVLEFNVRFGDPETQVLMPRLRSDLAGALLAAAKGSLAGVRLAWDERPAVCVVLASRGYPGAYETGKLISGLERAGEMEDVAVFHAGTSKTAQGVVTAGGRVLGVTAIGPDMKQSAARAYQAIQQIHFDQMTFRKDIAHRAMEKGS